LEFNELVTLTIHLTKVKKDVIEVLAIDILPSFFNRRHNHVQEIRTSALGKMVDSNSVDLLIEFNSGLKRDYGSKTRERKNTDTRDRSFDIASRVVCAPGMTTLIASALPFVAMLNRWGVCIPPNGLAIPSCRINVRIWRARVIKDRCLKKVGQREHTPR
jgi:hypothetical protein